MQYLSAHFQSKSDVVLSETAIGWTLVDCFDRAAATDILTVNAHAYDLSGAQAAAAPPAVAPLAITTNAAPEGHVGGANSAAAVASATQRAVRALSLYAGSPMCLLLLPNFDKDWRNSLRAAGAGQVSVTLLSIPRLDCIAHLYRDHEPLGGSSMFVTPPPSAESAASLVATASARAKSAIGGTFSASEVRRATRGLPI